MCSLIGFVVLRRERLRLIDTYQKKLDRTSLQNPFLKRTFGEIHTIFSLEYLRNIYFH